ncbi:hypothetical protein LEM8419_02330 [Neolewinella maritima]|uniref:GHMP kinase N-terminal domain-containing protein n=1 Tax=Neolewinella maritima TaxID=1383882 RepID=A0ABM9B2V7_9BACT|nr:mevalonate kinase [Neolewinella maritima]CAH1001427.1 hypothetical protein LEM8419_02330 [Neolewinella maritima]
MLPHYPAKIILFGEHTLLRGSRGLAIPYPKYSLRWTVDSPDDRLLALADYLRTRVPARLIDHDTLVRDLRQGAGLTGDIPTGYGLGSSGAVCAAVYDRYATPAGRALPMEELRHTLATMEGHFHGQSSGTDPLVSYLQQPLLLQGGDASAVQLPEGWREGFFLVDTGITRSASDLIARFVQAFDQDMVPDIRSGWMEPNERALTALLTGDRQDLYTAFRELSAYQLPNFPYLVPEAFRSVWDGGAHYRLKLCGAGGGGMLLGLARDRARTEATFGERLHWL